MSEFPFFVGIPPGVVNIIFGTGPKAGDALVGHPDVPLISFTGSTATAQRITERSAPHCKKLSLELGGKNPAIIFADADLDKCIETTVRSSFSNQVIGVFVAPDLSGLYLFIEHLLHGSTWPHNGPGSDVACQKPLYLFNIKILQPHESGNFQLYADL